MALFAVPVRDVDSNIESITPVLVGASPEVATIHRTPISSAAVGLTKMLDQVFGVVGLLVVVRIYGTMFKRGKLDGEQCATRRIVKHTHHILQLQTTQCRQWECHMVSG